MFFNLSYKIIIILFPIIVNRKQRKIKSGKNLIEKVLPLKYVSHRD